MKYKEYITNEYIIRIFMYNFTRTLVYIWRAKKYSDNNMKNVFKKRNSQHRLVCHYF